MKDLFSIIEETIRVRRVEGNIDLDFHLATEEEIKNAARTLKARKVPAVPEITAGIWKTVIEYIPEEITEMYNNILKRDIFPDMWKISKLVLIGKPGKKGSEASAYRLICLLNLPGKMLEKLLKDKIERDLNKKGKLSANRYDFRAGRSTIDAISYVWPVMDGHTL